MLTMERAPKHVRTWFLGLTNAARYGSVLTIFLSYFGQAGEPWAKLAGVQLFCWTVVASLQDSYARDVRSRLWLGLEMVQGLLIFSLGFTVHNTGWYWIMYLVLVIHTAATRAPSTAAYVTAVLFVLRISNLEAGPYVWPSQIFIQSLLTTTWMFFLLLAGGVVMADQAREKSRLETLHRELDQSHRELEGAYRRLKDYAQHIEEATVLKERARIARDIHDSLGHTMVGLVVQLEAAKRLLVRDAEQTSMHLGHALSLAQQGTVEVRHAIKALRPPLLIEGQLILAINRLIDDFSTFSGVTIVFRAPAHELILPDEVEVTIYRCLQEGLTNAFNHGRATRVSIQLRAGRRWIGVRVRDNGRSGRTASGTGLGLTAMRERVRAVGGHMRAEHRPLGFALVVVVPKVISFDDGKILGDGEVINKGRGEDRI